jgi:hypothetical protein
MLPLCGAIQVDRARLFRVNKHNDLLTSGTGRPYGDIVSGHMTTNATEAVFKAAADGLEHLYSRLHANFHEPDVQAVRIVLGTVKAHQLRLGDPVWLFIVAPPGAGKTTIAAMGLTELPAVHLISDFTENTLLSGFFGHREAGLLERLGTTVQSGNSFTTEGDAIFVAKDFTTVLSMRRESRAKILSQLREVHDGLFRRDFGTGESKIWKGRVAIIAAVTPVIDRFYSVFSVLGERFLHVRWHRPASEEAGEVAIRQQGREWDIQQEIRASVCRIVGQSATTAPALSAAQQARLANLAELVAKCRTHVFRESYGTATLPMCQKQKPTPD